MKIFARKHEGETHPDYGVRWSYDTKYGITQVGLYVYLGKVAARFQIAKKQKEKPITCACGKH